jgi:hypothetical protein
MAAGPLEGFLDTLGSWGADGLVDQPAGFRDGGHHPRAGACAGSAGVGAHMPCIRYYRVEIRQHLEPPASQCWKERNGGLLPPRVESAGGGLQLLVYQLGARLLCAGEQQGSLEVQHLAKIDETGNQWLRTRFGLKHHQVRSACHRRPAWLRRLTGRSGKHEREHGPCGRIAVIPADHGRLVRDVRGRP